MIEMQIFNDTISILYSIFIYNVQNEVKLKINREKEREKADKKVIRLQNGKKKIFYGNSTHTRTQTQNIYKQQGNYLEQ